MRTYGYAWVVAGCLVFSAGSAMAQDEVTEEEAIEEFFSEEEEEVTIDEAIDEFFDEEETETVEEPTIDIEPVPIPETEEIDTMPWDDIHEMFEEFADYLDCLDSIGDEAYCQAMGYDPSSTEVEEDPWDELLELAEEALGDPLEDWLPAEDPLEDWLPQDDE